MSARIPLPQFLGFNPQSAVELARAVFPCDSRCQLNDLVFLKEGFQSPKELIGHFEFGLRDTIRVLESNFFKLAEVGT